MTTWESVVDVARSHAMDLLVKGPVEPQLLIEKLMVLVDRDSLGEVALERNANGMCAYHYCRSKEESSATPATHDSLARFCTTECAARYEQAMAALPPTKLLYDDPMVLHTVKALFPQLERTTNVKDLLEGNVKRDQPDDATPGSKPPKAVGFQISERTATASTTAVVGADDEGRGGLDAGDMNAVLEHMMFASSEPSSSTGKGNAKGRKLKPQNEALSDFSAVISDPTRMMIGECLARRQAERSDFSVSGLFTGVPVLNGALSGQAEYGAQIGLAPYLGESSDQRCAALAGNIKRRLEDVALMLRLTEAQVTHLEYGLTSLLLPKLHFPEPIKCSSPAAWIVLTVLLLIPTALIHEKTCEVLSARQQELVEFFEAGGCNDVLLKMVVSYL